MKSKSKFTKIMALLLSLITLLTVMQTVVFADEGTTEDVGNTECPPYTFMITYNLNGGINDPLAPAGYHFGIGAILPMNPTRDGYIFAGWYDNAELTGEKECFIGPLECGDKEFWAAWTPIDYTITYNMNGGTNEEGAPVVYTCGIGAVLPDAPVFTGYTFAGWYGNPELTGDIITEITAEEFGNKEFWAAWSANDYLITYNMNGGTNEAGAPTGYTFGIGATLPTMPTKTGYTFLGWFDNKELTGTAITAVTATETGDKVFWASWDANDYTITYNLNGGTNPAGAPTGYTFGVGATLPVPTYQGYTFKGWYDNKELTGTAKTAVSATDTGNKTFWAKWEKTSTGPATGDNIPSSLLTAAAVISGTSLIVLLKKKEDII